MLNLLIHFRFVLTVVLYEGQQTSKLAWHTLSNRDRLCSALQLYTELALLAQIFDIFDFTGDRSSCATGARKRGIYLPMTTATVAYAPDSFPFLLVVCQSHPFFYRAPPHNGRNRSRRLLQ